MAKNVFKVNVRKNVESVGGGNRFVDPKPDTRNIYRFLPPTNENGLIFFLARNHYKLKKEEGTSQALACLGTHGNDETGTDCYLCNFSAAIEGAGNIPGELQGTFNKEQCNLYPNTRYYAQVLVGNNLGGGNIEWSRVKLLGLPRTVAEKVNKILLNQDEMGETLATDPEAGQPVIIERTGSGRSTKYGVDRSSTTSKLDDIAPNWQDEMYDDVYEQLGLTILTPDAQKEVLKVYTHPGLDWDVLEAEHGV